MVTLVGTNPSVNNVEVFDNLSDCLTSMRLLGERLEATDYEDSRFLTCLPTRLYEL